MRLLLRSLSLSWWLTLGLWLSASPAQAFQIETTVTGGCHESITYAALEAAGWGNLLAARNGELPALSDVQDRAVDDLPFLLVPSARNPWALALLIGVRSNDIRDNAPTEVASLVHIHNDPEDQAGHCIRRPQDDGSAGDIAALQACREFIEGELQAGGWFDGNVDTDASEVVATYLAFRGRVEFELPRFSYRLGRALHALEDGYTHTFRNPVTDQVRHVLNWIDMATDDNYSVERDGYAHLGVLDDCRRDHPGEIGRVNRASAAARQLLWSLTNSPDAETRQAAVSDVLDRVFRVEAGCDANNGYCNSGELDEAAGCNVAGRNGVAGMLMVVLAGLSCQRVSRRRRRGPPSIVRTSLIRMLVMTSGITAALVVVVVASPAWAQIVPHVEGRVGAALDKGGVAMALGAGVDRGRWGLTGLAEWNPWFSIDNAAVVAGTINAYGALTRRWYQSDKFSLHSRVEFGASVILFRLVGVDRGNLGFYFGGSILGIKIPLANRLDLILDPSHFAVPAPQVTGLPFYYRQYRVSAGLQWRW